MLVLCAISEARISTPYAGWVRGEAINAEVYSRRCLPRLIRFIETSKS
jgi:hypothetical protein